MKVTGIFHNAKTFKDAPAGTLIFEEGASGTEMFGVVEGEVEVRLPDGTVRRLGPDDTFGEMAIIDRSPRSGTVVAVTDTKLAVIDQNTFLFLVQETDVRAASDVEHGRAPSFSDQAMTASHTPRWEEISSARR